MLLVKIDLMIDTNTNQYYIQLRGLVKVSIEKDPIEILRIKLHFIFINYYFYPLRYIEKIKRTKIFLKRKRKRKQEAKLALETVYSY